MVSAALARYAGLPRSVRATALARLRMLVFRGNELGEEGRVVLAYVAGASATPMNVWRPWRFKKGRLRTRRRLFFTAELIQPFLHFVELPLELVHFAARTLRFFYRL